MIITKANFVQCSAKLADCPKTELPEVAFIGRSNVGKSSLINALCGRKALAKTSSTPGKTQTINHFLINDSFYIVDLPGYGYARLAKTMRANFNKQSLNYLANRENLHALFILLDANIPPQNIDMQFISKAVDFRIPLIITLSKTDKSNKKELAHNVATIQSKLAEIVEPLPQIVQCSSKNRSGLENLCTLIEFYTNFAQN